MSTQSAYTAVIVFAGPACFLCSETTFYDHLCCKKLKWRNIFITVFRHSSPQLPQGREFQEIVFRS